VTADDVLRVAREHVRPDRAAVVLVGDLDAFGEGLEAAGIGPVDVVRDPEDAADAEDATDADNGALPEG